jgi:2-iminobutanoate/2-iminopropanoate deaminase
MIQMTTYLVRAEHISDFYAARERIFPNLFPDRAYPPNSLLVVQRLVRPELLVEIQALAAAPARDGSRLGTR